MRSLSGVRPDVPRAPRRAGGLAATRAPPVRAGICKIKMPTMQNLKDHHLSKHGSVPLPAGIEEGIAAAQAKKDAEAKKKLGKEQAGGGGGGGGKKKKGGGDADLSLLMEGLGTGGKKKK